MSGNTSVLGGRAARPGVRAPITAREAAKTVVSMLHGMLLLQIDGVILETDESTQWNQRFAAVVWSGIGPTTEVA